MEELPFSEANFRMLLALVKSQSEEITYLKARIKELEGRLNQNSSNSSKPRLMIRLTRKLFIR